MESTHPNAADPALAKPPRSVYPPIEQFVAAGRNGAARTWTIARLRVKVGSDAQLLLSIAIVLVVVAMEGISDLTIRPVGLLAPLVFVLAQFWLTTLRTSPSWLPTARLGLCLVFLALGNVWIDPLGTWPLTALVLPVIALAAAGGGRGAIIIGLAGLAMMVVPLWLLWLPGLDLAARQAVFARAMAAILIIFGTRRIVTRLEDSSRRLRRANHSARRNARQLAAVEAVGSVLAREGPTPAALDRVMGVLEETFGYRYPSVYVWDGTALQLGAQRNYEFPIQTVSADRGVIGRIVRTGEPAFLRDARADPDFLSADPNVVSEIGVPLMSDAELLGILNVETNGDRRLDSDDFALMQIVGDRLAAALALGRERQKLTERASLLDRLTTFATVLGSSLDPNTMDNEVATGAAAVIPAESVVLVNLDPATGKYLINAIAGGDPSIIGKELIPGEGVSGLAIANRSVVVDDHMVRSRYPKAVADVHLPDELVGMAAPMITGDQVTGAITWLRADLSRLFTAQEQEVAALLAGKVGLALANARLHQATRDAAIRDPLTALHNRRHFDAAMEREDAVRRRTAAEKRPMRSAILFDLDHFGQVNKKYGHQIGDRVLRLFADMLRSRARASDLVARYGGEEFVVILENATREDATKIAEDVRTAFGQLTVQDAGGDPVTTTVSAGCATLEAWEVEGSLLLERADVALAMAKAGGRNQVVAA